jgi:hypothetical protein
VPLEHFGVFFVVKKHMPGPFLNFLEAFWGVQGGRRGGEVSQTRPLLLHLHTLVFCAFCVHFGCPFGCLLAFWRSMGSPSGPPMAATLEIPSLMGSRCPFTADVHSMVCANGCTHVSVLFHSFTLTCVFVASCVGGHGCMMWSFVYFARIFVSKCPTCRFVSGALVSVCLAMAKRVRCALLVSFYLQALGRFGNSLCLFYCSEGKPKCAGWAPTAKM